MGRSYRRQWPHRGRPDKDLGQELVVEERAAGSIQQSAIRRAWEVVVRDILGAGEQSANHPADGACS